MMKRSERVEGPVDRLALERAFWGERPGALLAGIDEAGRGPLAGPVVAGAVLIREADAARLAAGPLRGMNDSKQLTARRREALYETLTELPEVVWAVGMASASEIDELNILRATHLAMRRAAEGLAMRPDHLFVDGLPVKGLPMDHTAIVKGDAKSLLVACASVIAKVTRDRICLDLDREWPAYGFARHKGYGTREHLEALRRFGPTPEHRRSFAPVGAVQEEFDF